MDHYPISCPLLVVPEKMNIKKSEQRVEYDDAVTAVIQISKIKGFTLDVILR